VVSRRTDFFQNADDYLDCKDYECKFREELNKNCRKLKTTTISYSGLGAPPGSGKNGDATANGGTGNNQSNRRQKS
jgi:hypothetical protein